MLINFACENCGKDFSVDEHLHGRRGRCSNCGHVMRIPGAEASNRAQCGRSGGVPGNQARERATVPAQPTRTAADRRPVGSSLRSGTRARAASSHPSACSAACVSLAPGPRVPHSREPDVRFELLDDDADHAAIGLASPADQRGCRRDRRVPARSTRIQGRRRARRAVLSSGPERLGACELALRQVAGRASISCSSCFAGSTRGPISSRSRSSC